MPYGNDYESPGSKVPDKSRASGAKWHAEQKQAAQQSPGGGGGNSGGGGHGGGCFPGDAMVLMSKGTVPICDVHKGDEIMSLDRDGNIVTATVTRRVAHRIPRRLSHVVSNDADLSFWATSNHPVQTNRGWIRIKDLKTGDVLLYVDESGQVARHTVASVKCSDRIEIVFNLVVNGDHNFIIQGCVAHSFVLLHGVRCAVSKLQRVILPNNARLLPV